MDSVAAEAGVDPAWIERFAAPVLAEQARVLEQALGLVYDKPRFGPSRLPLGEAVARNVAQRGVRLGEEEKARTRCLLTDAGGRVIAASDKHQREVVSEAVQEVLNPEQQGAPPTVTNKQEREYLRQALLKRLKPVDALDANLFLFVNHLPHTRLLNTFFYTLTVIFNGGVAWYVVLGLRALRHRLNIRELIREIALPLTITTLLVEHPITSYFRRRRPFITIVQAIVIGKKHGTWSFPSGHSASAFGGAWLLNHKFERRWGLRYVLAGLVAFSRIYLGDHYPGDVASGSLLGLLFAMFFRKLFSIASRGRAIRRGSGQVFDFRLIKQDCKTPSGHS